MEFQHGPARGIVNDAPHALTLILTNTHFVTGRLSGKSICDGQAVNKIADNLYRIDVDFHRVRTEQRTP